MYHVITIPWCGCYTYDGDGETPKAQEWLGDFRKVVQLITEEKPEPRTVCVLHHTGRAWEVRHGGRGLHLGWATAALHSFSNVPAFLQRSCVHSTMLGTGDIWYETDVVELRGAPRNLEEL